MYTLETLEGLIIQTVTTGTIQFVNSKIYNEGFITYFKNSELFTIVEGGSASGMPVTTLYLCKHLRSGESELIRSLKRKLKEINDETSNLLRK